MASLVVGCGGGSDAGSETTASATKTTSTASISKAAFIAKADSVCSKADKQTQEKFAAYAKKSGIAASKEPTSAQFAVITKTILIPALHQQVAEIQALSIPAADQNRIDLFLRQIDDAIERAEEDPAKAGKLPRALLASADQVVGDYGFKVCGSR